MRSFEVTGGEHISSARVTLTASSGGIDFHRVDIELDEKRAPAPLEVSWEDDMRGIRSTWTPLGSRDRSMHQWWNPNRSISRFCFGAPVLATVGENGMNVATVAVSDVETPVEVTFRVKDLEQRDKVGYAVKFFERDTNPLKKYSAELRIDSRELPFYETVMDVSAWWESFGYIVPTPPEAAEYPLYSSWYNFHQNPTQAELTEELRIAAKLGFRSAIIDDGWQMDAPCTGDYYFCGDWQVSEKKFPDFRRFVDEIHGLGIKLTLWFTVPFVGAGSAVCGRFEGKYLRYDAANRAYVLDPRYPEVRDYIASTYERFVRDYDLDGLKLDFIDSFAAGELTREPCAEMDCAVIEDGVRKLLGEIWERLGAVKSGLLYEFRQNYVGPSILKYGNMLRVGDCAYDSLQNRVSLTDIRLLNYRAATHSDMLLWSKLESERMCCKQLLNILFSVPQISVRLTDCTDGQTELVRAFVRYWEQNRETLLHGSFRAEHPELNYTELSSERGGKRITALYSERPYRFDGVESDVWNAGDCDGIVLENSADAAANIMVYDFRGELLSRTALGAKEIVRIDVPVAGRMNVKLQII